MRSWRKQVYAYGPDPYARKGVRVRFSPDAHNQELPNALSDIFLYMARPRTWSDEDLRTAVRESSTWGEVVQKIGLTDFAKARRTAQGHCVRLGLDVAHLPAFKPVAPIEPHDSRWRSVSAEVAAAVPDSTSWADVFRKLGLPITGSGYMRLKEQAERLGLDTSHFRGQGWSSKPVEGIATPFSRDPQDRYLQKAAVAIATAWFLGRGYMVSIPVEPTTYDLVAESDNGLARVQVKSTMSRDRNGRWLVRIHHKPYDRTAKRTASGARTNRAYSPDEIDFFFIVTAAEGKYLIPLAETGTLGTLTLDSKYAAYKVT